MENPFKKAVKDENQTKEIEQGVEEQLNASENTENAEDTETEAVEAVETETGETQSEEVKAEQTEEAKDETNLFKEKYETLNNQYIRLAADFDNFRKRNAQEREALLKYGAEATLKNLLEVLDTVDDCAKVKECYNLAYKNFTDVLTKSGLEAIKAEGEEFNPNFHEAVMQTPTTEVPEHTIIAELQKGYKLGDKVLRPSLVNVATEG